MRALLRGTTFALMAAWGAVNFSACGNLKASKLDVGEWTIELSVEPDRHTYLPSERVFVDARVYTKEGSLVGDPPLIWEAIGATEVESGVFQLAAREAAVTIQACLELEGVTNCSEVELGVDVSPPELVIRSPQPADELLQTAERLLRIEGTIEDSNPDARLTIYANGVAATIDAAGNFHVDIPSSFGINMIEVQASDGFHAPTYQRMNVLVANSYLAPVEGTTRFELDDVVTLRLTQKFFDRVLGNSILDLTTMPVQARDLASMIELILLHLDLSDLFGDEPILEVDDLLEISIGSLQVGDAVVDIELLDEQGLKLSLAINDVFVETSGWVDIVGTNLIIAGGLATDIRGDIKLLINTAPDGTVSATLEVIELGIANIEPRFEGSDGAFFDALIDLGTVQRTFRDLLQEQIEGPMIGEFLDVIPQTIVDLLNSIPELLDGIEFDLDTDIMPSVTLKLGAELKGFFFKEGAEDGYLDASLNANIEVESETGPIHTSSRGVAVDIEPEEVPLDIIGAAQIAIRQDFVNGLLHAVWNSGFLNTTMVQAGLQIGIDLRLPPILTLAPLNSDCIIDGERCDAVLQIGQLVLTLNGREFFMFLEAGASFGLRNNELSLKITETAKLEVWATRPFSSFPKESDVVTLFDTMLWSEILNMLGEGGGISIPIPIPPPSELGLDSIAPGLEFATLQLEALRGLRIASGFLGVSLDLLFEVPDL